MNTCSEMNHYVVKELINLQEISAGCLCLLLGLFLVFQRTAYMFVRVVKIHITMNGCTDYS
jgi:hypothetical protein